ncbi:hypothetical protein CPSG_05294 [Coccidioides posadasii str. Silveira]|uniref:Uncharacterized protein n=1 Tax=Coccidioides posadasii (strain RMSCC 757 / Silveira) TaxID=443226 RepID=E9D526_COCPS|nr:hypothetical protein CPSG_05294 [Coccidioides posadasii str. Silveira]
MWLQQVEEFKGHKYPTNLVSNKTLSLLLEIINVGINCLSPFLIQYAQGNASSPLVIRYRILICNRHTVKAVDGISEIGVICNECCITPSFLLGVRCHSEKRLG